MVSRRALPVALSDEQVRSLRLQHGVPVDTPQPEPRAPRGRVSPEHFEREYIRMRAEGLSQLDMALALGVSQSWVSKMVKQLQERALREYL